ncbi:MAG: radical SAM protein [Spirochaetes bacterium]|nr:radical SAM protein [Spirochaetota bacterium]
MKAAFINTNLVKPPIAPIGLEYVAESVRESGHDVSVLDLCFEEDPETAVMRFFRGTRYDLVGLTLRNTDDCALASRVSFIERFLSIVSVVRNNTDAFLVIGGAGFSVMPVPIMKKAGADAGVWGPGERAVTRLMRKLEKNEEWGSVSNLLAKSDGGWRMLRKDDREEYPDFPFHRDLVDNRRYFREGGQAGFETKRGCSKRCIYCADPVSKGRTIRTRHPDSVVEEIQSLLTQGIDVLHTCDSEFNIPPGHARAVCRRMIRAGLGDKIRWYAYCSPAPFPRGLAGLMRRAGCAGINFGADTADAKMLKRLGRDFRPQDITHAVKACAAEGITTMIDLLIGGPNEGKESITRSIERIKSAGPDRIGINVGVRVYPGTPLHGMVAEKDCGLVGNGETYDPRFYLEPAVAKEVFDLVGRLTRNDERFFFLDPAKDDRNYNYNENKKLVEEIRLGARGAYWDILRKASGE